MTSKTGAAPWSVKGVDRATREMARQAAQAAGMTVGAWIEQAIRSHEMVLAARREAEPDPAAEVMAAAQRADVRALESGVERMESRTGDMVIPVALKVQELAHRLVEIEQARVAGRARPVEPAPEPPHLVGEPSPPPPFGPDDDFERFRVPEPEPEPEPPVEARTAASEDFPTPVPPPEEPPSAEPLVFAAETAIPADRPHRRDWARPRRQSKPKRRRAVGVLARVLAAVVALILGAGSVVVVLEHGEAIGLPPRLGDRVAAGLERALDEGRRLAVAGEETVVHWFHDIRSLFVTDQVDAEPSMTPAEPPRAETAPAAPTSPPAEPARSPEAPPPARSDAPPSTSSSASQAAPPASTPAPAPPPAPAQIAAIAPPPSSSSAPRPGEPAQAFPTLTQPSEPPPATREIEELEKAARQGEVKAQYELGVLAAQPESGQPDYGKAAYWFREAAVQGNPSAQYNLGVLYEHGLGVASDDVRALLWYHSAAEQGHARAQYNLGVYYAQGRGIPTDYGEAQRWFKKAADQGVAKAFYNLAVLAESGLGAPANPTAARALMSRAALLGDPDARAALAKAPPSRPDPGRSDPSRPQVEVIGAVQHMLTDLGYDAGRIDGVLGDKTRQAIRKFQGDNGLAQTGTASEELLEVLTARIGPAPATASQRR
jgi:hypothetical protein